MKIFLPDREGPIERPLHSRRETIAADAVGLATLTVIVALGAHHFSREDVAVAAWCALFAALATMNLGLWHAETSRAPATVPASLAAVACSLVLLAASLAGDILVGHRHFPALPLLEAAKLAPGPFGWAFTVSLCPAAIIFSVCTLARNLFLSTCRSATIKR